LHLDGNEWYFPVVGPVLGGRCGSLDIGAGLLLPLRIGGFPCAAAFGANPD
jgi:hypothetical protein